MRRKREASDPAGKLLRKGWNVASEAGSLSLQHTGRENSVPKARRETEKKKGGNTFSTCVRFKSDVRVSSICLKSIS